MKSIWIAGVLLMAPILASGEELPGLQASANLTLANVVEKAFLRSPQQQVLQAGKMTVDARSAQATSVLPMAPAVSMRHQTDQLGSGRNLREWEAALEIPVWLPGQRSGRVAVARDAAGSLEARRSSHWLELAGQVREAVWDIEMNQNTLELATQRMKTAQALLLDVEKRWKAGELAKMDVLMAQNETLQAQTALLRAQAEVRHAEHRYQILTGLKEIPAKADEQPVAQPGFEGNHPLLVESARQIALAQDERVLAGIEKRENPMVVVSARNERGAFDNAFNNSIGVAIRLPLGSAVRSAPLLAGAEMNLAQARSEHEQRILMLQTAQHEAEHNLEVTRSELEFGGKQHQLAQENLRLAKKAFDLGESDLVGLLRVQSTAQDAERALRSRQIQLKRDVARYNQAAGVLP